MDLFDPFSPTATDTEYKPGTDMLYVQRLFADGSDLQLAIAPRPPRSGAAPTADASTAALHLHAALLGHQTTWLLARDHGDLVGALGVNGDLGGATWNLEVVPIVRDRQGVGARPRWPTSATPLRSPAATPPCSPNTSTMASATARADRFRLLAAAL